MRCLYPRCEHGRVIEQGECSDCLRAENERLKAARLEHSSLCEGSVGLPCDLPSVCDPLRAEVERLRGLIAEAEWVQALGPVCPWCRYPQVTEHSPDCPAFSARGEVRR